MYYLCRMIFDRKISGFANVNRVIARVCGGGTLANMPRLRGALPEAKGNGGGVQVGNRLYSRVLTIAAIIFILFVGKNNRIYAQVEPIKAMQDVKEFQFLIIFGEAPKFNGGSADEKFRDYLFSMLKYPEEAVKNNITGRVVVEFLIEKDGSVVDAAVVQNTHPLLDDAALQVISSSPAWTPGFYKDEPVKVRYRFPFVFTIPEGWNYNTDSIAVEIISGSDADMQTQDKELEDETMNYVEVDVKPLFDGNDADEAFREYVLKNFIYPRQYAEINIRGRVIVEFIIEIDGSITNAKTIRDFDCLVDAELLRVINSSPKWTAGFHDGKAVRVRYQFLFLFMLK